MFKYCIFYGGALQKNSGKIGNWVRGSNTVDVGLGDIDFVVYITLQNMLSIRVDEKEILGGKIIWSDKKLEYRVSRKL